MEIALGFALRDALRSGDIYLPESRRHVSFLNLVYDESQWAQERSGAYKQLSLFPEADTVRRSYSRNLISSLDSWIKACRKIPL